MLMHWLRKLGRSNQGLGSMLQLQLFSFISGVATTKKKPATVLSANRDYKTSKPLFYWTNKSADEIILEADTLFEDGHFMEVYELLNRLKFNNNADVQWRICRALFQLSRDDTISHELRKEMLNEAYELLASNTIEGRDNNSPNVYKWMAIILDAKSGAEGLDQRVKSYDQVKSFLMRAVELNPEDSIALYILGKWCFEMSKLSPLQRMIAQVLYGTVPQSSYQEAYKYLLKSYEVDSSKYYIPNMYMLGETCLHLKRYYLAKFYLSAATANQPRTLYEKECAKKAKLLLNRLDAYDLSKDTIFFDNI